MQQSNAPSKLPLAFAASGGKNAIPTASNPTPGGASLADGFPPLTRTDPTAGGKPPSGLDMNGILNAISAINRWSNAGGGYAYDGAFATDSNVMGYPKGAVVLTSDGLGEWKNLVDNNQADPEGANTNWIPSTRLGNQGIVVSNANVTLSYLQANKYTINLNGTLTANINLILPAWNGIEWLVIGSFSGNFTVTCKTASGSGVAIKTSESKNIYCDGTSILLSNVSAVADYVSPIQTISATVASNSMAVGLAATTLQFRSGTLGSGAITQISIPPLSLTVPSGATLGSLNTVAANYAVVVAYNGGSPVLCITNMSGAPNLGEDNLISPTTISAGATLTNVIYSASAVSANSPYRVVGYITATQATAGTWAAAPSLVQGQGGQAFSAFQSLGYGQTWFNFTSVTRAIGTTYYNTFNKPIALSIVTNTTGSTLTINGANVTTSNTGQCAFFAIVPPGGTYVVTGGTWALWAELR
ncbi:hypothetical protein UFOVP150_19 [uncultured Caudovirales phage]|uniref:Tail fiber protein n=1 Tax=uncultured Caudovirales phage TaxID=2100421 RepID=A0A6J7W9Y5_9CAUD|nr:hypothetical protein UFOVP150_19 [uncultured Caudovirales phage]